MMIMTRRMRYTVGLSRGRWVVSASEPCVLVVFAMEQDVQGYINYMANTTVKPLFQAFVLNQDGALPPPQPTP